MDKKRLSEEIAQNMKQENGMVSLPLEIWNKLAICLDEAERKDVKVAYVCDHRECEVCNDCGHTWNIRHAENFELKRDVFVEVDH